MCGIYGWNGLNPKQFNKDKFNVLGIINMSRGKDSCGISINGEIYTTTTKANAEYASFIEEKYHLFDNYPTILKSVIGHNRQASRGIVSPENAHPFGFGSITLHKKYEIFEFIGCHNGTIYNDEFLAKKYNVDLHHHRNDTRVAAYKIDSEVLLESLYNDPTFEALQDYNGGAALLWVNANKPNSIFAYHGKSPNYKHGLAVEERPLFYWKESQNSIYFSSIESALYMIGGTTETVEMLPHNAVYEITNGNIDEAVIYPIDRSNVIQSKEIIYPNNQGRNHHGVLSFDEDYDWDYNKDSYSDIYAEERKKSRLQNAAILRGETPIKVLKPITLSIHKQNYPENAGKTIVYNKLLYKSNGHPISGIFVHQMSAGFIALGKTFEEARAYYKKYEKAHYNPNTKMFSLTYDVPYYLQPLKLVTENSFIYIYEGVLLKSKEDYIALSEFGSKYGITDFDKIKEASYYPIIPKLSKKEVKRITNDKCYWKSDMLSKEYLRFSGSFCPIGTTETYVFKEGNLTSIQTSAGTNYVLKLPTIDYTVKDSWDEIIKTPINTVIELPASTCNANCSNEPSKKDDSKIFEDGLDLLNSLKLTNTIVEKGFKELKPVLLTEKQFCAALEQITEELNLTIEDVSKRYTN